MLIETETTPNPATLKFLPGRAVMEAGTRDFANAGGGRSLAAGGGAIHARRCEGVFFGSDFVSVTARAGRRLARSQARCAGVLLDHFAGDVPLFRAGSASDIAVDGGGEEFGDDPADADIVAQISELIDTRVRPAVANDGGDIVYRGFDSAARCSWRCRAPARAAPRRPRR